MKRIERYEPQLKEVFEVDDNGKIIQLVAFNPIQGLYESTCEPCFCYRDWTRHFPCGSIVCGVRGPRRSDGEEIILLDKKEAEEIEERRQNER